MPNPMRQKAIEGLKVADSFTYSRTFQKEETEQFGDMTETTIRFIMTSDGPNQKGLIA